MDLYLMSLCCIVALLCAFVKKSPTIVIAPVYYMLCMLWNVNGRCFSGQAWRCHHVFLPLQIPKEVVKTLFLGSTLNFTIGNHRCIIVL